ncbi:MAG: hypothetical protein LBC44_04630 [Mycoplasmataceae bacterium]|jgi:hypothetical protein|nr:hypothetical protein [Mycoplasmataceae bacterium]
MVRKPRINFLTLSIVGCTPILFLSNCDGTNNYRNSFVMNSVDVADVFDFHKFTPEKNMAYMYLGETEEECLPFPVENCTPISFPVLVNYVADFNICFFDELTITHNLEKKTAKISSKPSTYHYKQNSFVIVNYEVA